MINQNGQSEQQIFISTHNSLIASRLDLKNALLLRGQETCSLSSLDEDTAKFFIKAPNHKLLEFILSERVILVEGDAEFILLDEMYRTHVIQTTASNNIYLMSVDGMSFKRFMTIAKLLSIKTAVIRDNDSDGQKNCIDNYSSYIDDHIKVFFDADDSRHTFEICVYQDNQNICNALFTTPKRQLPIQEYMLKNKTDVALALLEKSDDLAMPQYIREAFEWISM